MPLPSGTISLSNIANISGAYNMNDDSARKLCGVSRSSGTSWSMSDAQGKAWVTSVTPTDIGYTPIPFAALGAVTYNFNGGGTAIYTAQVNVYARQGIYNTTTRWSYTYNRMTDTGGGYTTAPTLTLTVVTTPFGSSSETYTGVLSGSG